MANGSFHEIAAPFPASIAFGENHDPTYRGVLAPVVLRSEPISRLMKNVSSRIANGCFRQNCGLAVFGTTSEANSRWGPERATLLDARWSRPESTYVLHDPWCGCCSITETVKLTSQAVSMVGVLMLPPFYYKGVSRRRSLPIFQRGRATSAIHG